jgi:hypothetical protein
MKKSKVTKSKVIKLKKTKKIEYKEHGKNCLSCMNYDKPLKSCCVLLRNYVSHVRVNNDGIKYYYADGVVGEMFIRVYKNMGIDYKDTHIDPAKLNEKYSCPFHTIVSQGL